MVEGTINQRLKFLIEHLSTSVRAFSEAIGDSSSNTQNYIGARKVEPKPEYLAKVINHFNTINAHWLLTGNGEPFLPTTNENGQTTTINQKNFRSPVVGNNQGTANQQQHSTSSDVEVESTKNKLALAEKEIEHLRAQLSMKDALIISKEETIELLRANQNRSN